MIYTSNSFLWISKNLFFYFIISRTFELFCVPFLWRKQKKKKKKRKTHTWGWLVVIAGCCYSKCVCVCVCGAPSCNSSSTLLLGRDRRRAGVRTIHRENYSHHHSYRLESIKTPGRADNLVSCQCSFVFIKWRLKTSCIMARSKYTTVSFNHSQFKTKKTNPSPLQKK
jgi:hypothetical protein